MMFNYPYIGHPFYNNYRNFNNYDRNNHWNNKTNIVARHTVPNSGKVVPCYKKQTLIVILNILNQIPNQGKIIKNLV